MASPRMPAIDADLETIQLGRYTYELVPQPVPLVKHDLKHVFDGLTGGEIDASNIGAYFTGGMHKFLSVFIPDLMPEYEWEGYRSEQAREDGLLDREFVRATAPDGPQVRLAMRMVLKVNGLDGYKSLMALVDPTTRQVLTAKAIRWLESAISASESSPLAPTPSTTSSPPDSPTEDASGASIELTESQVRSIDSSGSSSPPADASASTG